MKGDPYRMTAKFSSTCPTCGKPIKKGDDITYWPTSRRAYHWTCSESDYRHFLAEKSMDEHGNDLYYER